MSFEIWSVYRVPGRGFGARCFHVDALGLRATDATIAPDKLERVRLNLALRGLARRPRVDGDPPLIVESWRGDPPDAAPLTL